MEVTHAKNAFFTLCSFGLVFYNTVENSNFLNPLFLNFLITQMFSPFSLQSNTAIFQTCSLLEVDSETSISPHVALKCSFNLRRQKSKQTSFHSPQDKAGTNNLDMYLSI